MGEVQPTSKQEGLYSTVSTGYYIGESATRRLLNSTVGWVDSDGSSLGFFVAGRLFGLLIVVRWLLAPPSPALHDLVSSIE
jgi:hypothetical protein